MNILIVSPKYEYTVGAFYAFPIGLANISSILKKNGYNVECLNANHFYEPMGVLLKNVIIDKKIDIVCTGGISPLYNKLREIFVITKQINPGIITILGGGIVSSEPIITMEMIQEADIGVIGEGENAILEILSSIVTNQNLSTINGIVFKNSMGKITKTSKREQINNIDLLPYPDYQGFELDKLLSMQSQNDLEYWNLYDKPRIVPIIASRSCPYKCTFCFHPLGNKYRQHSLDYIFGLIEYLIHQFKANGFAIFDELFMTKNRKDKFVEFCHRIKKYKIQWNIQLRVDTVDESILRLAKESGCTYISYGLESACNKILKSMKKIITVKQIEKALHLTHECGIGTRGNFIFGDEKETLETAFETLRWWANNKKYTIALSLVQPYPGTTLYLNAINKGVIKSKKDFMRIQCPIINITKMSQEEWQYLIDTVNNLNYYNNLIPGYVLKCKRTKRDSIKGSLYALELICPRCGEVSKYPNMNIPHNIGINKRVYHYICCKTCRQLFNVLIFNVQERIQTIISIVCKNRSGIYFKEGKDNQILFTVPVNLLNKIKYIVHHNITQPEYQFLSGLKKELISETDMKLLDLKFLIYPVYSYDEEDISNISKFEKQGIKVLKLYFFKEWETANHYITQLIHNQKIDEAAELLDYVRSQFFLEPNLENLEGEIETLTGNIEKAEHIFLDIQRKWPQNWLTYNNLGVLYFTKGDINRSFQYMSYAKKLSPNNKLIDSQLEPIRLLVKNNQ